MLRSLRRLTFGTAKYLPAFSYLSRSEEALFRAQLNARLLNPVSYIGYIAIGLLTLFFVKEAIEHPPGNSLTNLIRLALVLSIVVVLHLGRRASSQSTDKLFSGLGIFLAMQTSLLFTSYVLAGRDLNIGTIMLAAVFIASIPILHLGQKMIMWLIVACCFVLVHISGRAEVGIAPVYYFAAIAVLSATQYQMDVLLREQFRAERNQTRNAHMDQLTGLYNRRSLDRKFNELRSRQRPGDTLAVAMVDVDYFKKYNDYYGHLEGDRVLITVADLLQKLDAAMVVRFGGEEFVLFQLFSGPPPEWLADLPARMERLNISNIRSKYGHLTVSAGIAYHTKYDMEQVDSGLLLTQADRCLYQAKDAGRNCVFSTRELPHLTPESPRFKQAG